MTLLNTALSKVLIFAIIVFRSSKLPVEKGIHFRTGLSAVTFFSLFGFGHFCVCVMTR